jgi:hypothetical protein
MKAISEIVKIMAYQLAAAALSQWLASAWRPIMQSMAQWRNVGEKWHQRKYQPMAWLSMAAISAKIMKMA